MAKTKKAERTTKDLLGDFQGRMELLLKGESFASFAAQTNLTKSQVQSIMRDRVPGIDKAAAIAKGMGVRLDWLILGEGPMYISGADETGLESFPPELMQKMMGDLETIGQMVEHFEANIREDEKVYTPRQVGAIIRLLCIMAYSDVRAQTPADILKLVKDIGK